MPDTILKGYLHPIYAPKGLKEFVSKEYNIPDAKKDKEFLTLHEQILSDVSNFEKFFKSKTAILTQEFNKGETQRYSHQFGYITMKNIGKKYTSNLEYLIELGEKTDDIIEKLCTYNSKIKNLKIKTKYSELISPITKLYKTYPAIKIALELYEEYFAVKDTENLVNHLLKRDVQKRGDEDVNLGTTLFYGKVVKLPENQKLTNNNSLAFDKSGNFYYIRLNGKLYKYNTEGKKIAEISQGSFGDSINHLQNKLKEIWGI